LGDAVNVKHHTDGRRDPVDGHLSTACGLRSLTGGIGELDDRDLASAWAFVTCKLCLRRVSLTAESLSAPMRRLLAVKVRGDGAPHSHAHTFNALVKRGLLWPTSCRPTDFGRTVAARIEERKSK
jgi:hypothetical protein